MSDWQQTIALTLVALAIAYLLRGLWRPGGSRRVRACGSCRTCDVGSAPNSPSSLPIVDVGTLVSSAEEAAGNTPPPIDC